MAGDQGPQGQAGDIQSCQGKMAVVRFAGQGVTETLRPSFVNRVTFRKKCWRHNMFTLKAFIPPAAVMWLGLAWIPVHAQTSWSGDLVDFTLVAGDLGAFGGPEVVSDDTGVSLNFNPAPLAFDALSAGTGEVDSEISGFTLTATA